MNNTKNSTNKTVKPAQKGSQSKTNTGKVWPQNNNSWQGSSQKSSGVMSEFGSDAAKLNDADIITDILTTQKGLVKMYSTAITETDCPHLRDIFNTQLTECADDQFDSFLYMNERGLYPTEQAPMPKIKQAKKLFESKEKTFDK